MSIDVGIENINIYGSQLAIDSKDIANRRNLSEKNIKDVGFFRRSIVPLFEDPVTLAVNAANPLLSDEDRKNIGLLIVATESGLDFGKPLSSYVHRYLKLGPHCRNFEIKHACYGGTAALHMALNWLRNEGESGKKALVISTDVARSHIGYLAELTAGTGAIALLLSTNPQAAIIHPISGYAAQEVYDVARPTLKFEFGDPVLSLYSYLDLLELAWEDYARKHNLSLKSLDKHFDYLLYHTPLISLVEKAHMTLVKMIEEEITDEEIELSLASKVKPALTYNLELGNIYSGSVYVALTGLLHLLSTTHTEANRKEVGLFSYGSGACAEFFSATVNANFTSPSLQQTEKHLKGRQSLSVDSYEKLLKEYEDILHMSDFKSNLDTDPHYHHLYKDKGLLVLDSIEHYYRTYQWS